MGKKIITNSFEKGDLVTRVLEFDLRKRKVMCASKGVRVSLVPRLGEENNFSHCDGKKFFFLNSNQS